MKVEIKRKDYLRNYRHWIKRWLSSVYKMYMIMTWKNICKSWRWTDIDGAYSKDQKTQIRNQNKLIINSRQCLKNNHHNWNQYNLQIAV